jgi:hypothetical protein
VINETFVNHFRLSNFLVGAKTPFSLGCSLGRRVNFLLMIINALSGNTSGESRYYGRYRRSLRVAARQALAALIAGVIYIDEIGEGRLGRPSGGCRMSRRTRWGVVGLFALGAGLHSLPAYAAETGQLQPFEQASGGEPASGSGMLYIAQDRAVHVYDENTWKLVRTINLAQIHGVRGIDISRGGDSMLYISYENDLTQPGWVLKYDLVNNRVVWNKRFPNGIDQFSLSRDGTKMYMPAQALPNGEWTVHDTSDGSQIGIVAAGGGQHQHNTVTSISGAHVYLGNEIDDHLTQIDADTFHITKRIGPLLYALRPMTINGKETLAFTTATDRLGFQVSDIASGQVLYTISMDDGSGQGQPVLAGRNGAPCAHAGPVRLILRLLGRSEAAACGWQSDAVSHGISLRPDERELYVLDGPNARVHVFDITGLPETAPREIAAISVHTLDGVEANCSLSCTKDGWLTNSTDGRYVFVGDSGDVISTATHGVVEHLPELLDSRHFAEGVWRNGKVVDSARFGVGRVQ